MTATAKPILSFIVRQTELGVGQTVQTANYSEFQPMSLHLPDYDGDGKTDLAVYSDGNWYITLSNNNSFFAYAFGNSTDLPITGAFVR